MIDTHAHLYAPEFDTDLPEVIQRAKKIGIEEIWIPGTDSESLNQMERLRQIAPGYFRFFGGLHPSDVNASFREELDKIRKMVDAGSYSGIGEIGLDLYWDKTFLEEQKEAFIYQLDWALERKQPVLIHVREAFEETMPIIRNYYSKNLKGIFHCFAGNQEQAEELTGEGFLLGINGNITYKKAPVAKFLQHIPLEYIVTETDAPYLAPTPHRGKRNESQYIPLVIQKLSEIYALPAEQIEKQTVLNAKKLLA
ncbi:MAG: TatD family hydrolase [Bacteroidales bacterium]|nr:TatD family hydrolase [Bacteroidales bacterium]